MEAFCVPFIAYFIIVRVPYYWYAAALWFMQLHINGWMFTFNHSAWARWLKTEENVLWPCWYLLVSKLDEIIRLYAIHVMMFILIEVNYIYIYVWVDVNKLCCLGYMPCVCLLEWLPMFTNFCVACTIHINTVIFYLFLFIKKSSET